MSIHRGLIKKDIVILRQVQNVLAITIPSHIYKQMKWDKGDILILTADYEKRILKVQQGKVEVA